MSLLSPTGQSRMWDADANGYARGDGIAAVVMKRLSDAIADGDHIECLIRQTGVNQDGKSTGLTVPSSEAQAALIRTTYARGGLDMSNPKDWPQYFEAHGTGTKAGDPREASAIDQCFGSQPINGNPLYVGSIKTIIGHTEGTAGLAGVLKASLAIQHGLIPPNMLLNRMNPDVAQYCRNLEVPQNLIAWPELPEGVPRRASVNSFGMSYPFVPRWHRETNLSLNVRFWRYQWTRNCRGLSASESTEEVVEGYCNLPTIPILCIDRCRSGCFTSGVPRLPEVEA